MVNEQRQPQQVRLKIPASRRDLEALTPGTVVYLDGVVYTGREGVYKKVIAEGAPLPIAEPWESMPNQGEW